MTQHHRRSLARRTFLTGVAGSAATAILAACGGSKATNTPVPATTAPPAAPAASSSAAPASAPAGANSVSIASFAFAPPSITVAPGQTVTWTNKDTTTHTVTEDKGAWDSKNLAAGATFQQKFDQAGTFTYHCNIHSSMKGTVVVKA
jgi:plastocyanin